MPHVEDQRVQLRESDLVELIVNALRGSGADHIYREFSVGPRSRVDIAVVYGESIEFIEVKRTTPQTRKRLEEALAQIRRYGEMYAEYNDGIEPQLSLFFPGPVSQDRLRDSLSDDVRILDMDWLRSRTQAAHQSNSIRDILNSPFASHAPPNTSSPGADLLAMLQAIPPGREHWQQYQKLCVDIFDYLFSPPLSPGIYELSNYTKTNRRDIIMPNYATEGFWRYMREKYHADHIVIDAKNYTDRISKDLFIQMANYLTEHGPGLFGIIASRVGGNGSSVHIVREQWMMHRKLIITFTDDDLAQMIETKEAGESPEILIQQKIEDFRLSI